MHVSLSSCRAFGAIAAHVPPASPQVGRVTAAITVSPVAVYIGGAIVAALFVVVIWPAVWSKNRDRREAAKNVLDSILQTLDSILRLWRR